jgi:5-methylcytosine-specific restriction endonuclease McrA
MIHRLIFNWGRRNVEKKVRRGNLLCPNCHQDSNYTLFRISQYFTISFIPVRRLGKVGEYGLCHSCGEKFSAHFTKMTRQAMLEMIAPWQCKQCGNENKYSDTVCRHCNGLSSSAAEAPAPSESKSALRPRSAVTQYGC